MHQRLDRQARRRFVAGRLVVGALIAAAARAALADTGASPTTAPPADVARALAGARLAGEGELRYFGLRIYAARLWVGPQFDADRFDAYPLALELTYHRAFSGEAIANRSIEEIERQQALPAAQSDRWRLALSALIPDVRAGDRLTGVFEPERGLVLSRDGRTLGAIADLELARRFIGIWLAAGTSEPALRRRLLARLAGLTGLAGAER